MKYIYKQHVVVLFFFASFLLGVPKVLRKHSTEMRSPRLWQDYARVSKIAAEEFYWAWVGSTP